MLPFFGVYYETGEVRMVGDRLKEVRKDRGDTQSDLAEKLQVSLSTVKSWEGEKSSPSHELLVQICRLYQVSSDYLLGLSKVDPFVAQKVKHQLIKESTEDVALFEEFMLYRQSRR